MESDKLNIVWATENRDTFLHMIAMYAFNAKKQGWFQDVNMIIWGPSARLASEDREVQETILKMIEQGVHFEACRACADIYGVSKKLENFGVDVKYMGKPLTAYLKSGEKTLSF